MPEIRNQENAKEGRLAGGCLDGLFSELTDEPIGDQYGISGRLVKTVRSGVVRIP
jgi:hypothetical protein